MSEPERINLTPRPRPQEPLRLVSSKRDKKRELLHRVLMFIGLAFPCIGFGVICSFTAAHILHLDSGGQTLVRVITGMLAMFGILWSEVSHARNGTLAAHTLLTVN